ncbi:hypothetical protein CcCBS67573_g01529 [Chytriomyces confervae]|uniref:tRNA-dihydrouridine(16/17) synthase [NAD(P)(+)] n=1 Tax=Chytriomyces confervae TaxID=246404 RepID=A0A507FQA2_9FUNG|nr:hypothetical protein CcCBS67573_g01529 [Chytriomyces confervae]
MIVAETFLSNETYRRSVFDPSRGDGAAGIDRPLVVQIAGRSPETLVACALQLESHCDAIDLNLGCPQQRAKDGGYGAYLLPRAEWECVRAIVEALVKALRVPVWCKIRLVPGANGLSAEFARMLELAGCALITVHGRYASTTRRRNGLADLAAIKAVKDAVTIPVMTNGNVRTFQDIEANLSTTGADGIMVGEALLSNPWLFSGKEPDPTRIIHEYLSICEQVHPAAFSIASARQHVRNFLRSNLRSNNPKFKEDLGAATNVDEIILLLHLYNFVRFEDGARLIRNCCQPQEESFSDATTSSQKQLNDDPQ